MVSVADGSPRRDYLYVDDFVQALRVIANAPSRKVRIYNAGSGVSYSVRQVIDTLCDILGEKLPVTFRNERRPNEIDDCYADYQRLSADFDWQPKIDLRHGLESMITAWKDCAY